MAELSSNWKKLQATLSHRNQAKTNTTITTEGAATTKAKRIVKKNKTARPVGVRKSLHEARGTSKVNLKGCQSTIKMGGVHSSKMSHDTREDQMPSLELWTRTKSTTSESIADVYGLGIKNTPLTMRSHNDRVNHGRSPNVDVGKYVAVDCEMVGVGFGGHESALARVSLVDFHGRQVYDSYVKPTQRVTDWRSHVSGVSPKEMRFARDFVEVQKEVSSIIQGRILIGHDIKHDLEALKLSHPPKDIRDTAKHPAFRKFGNGRKPALRNLAREILGVEIQEDSHSSTEDARATMLLFRKDKPNFDIGHANRYRQTITTDGKKENKKHKQRR
ncbi:hypothetical protein E4U43_005709 [Claviceps pusilla]|uniref:RNA exonuclease 4 n=1 Tax=Claviceps pusilla TaxID=123648 RepID=A0A9P7NH76_9HYPO|nr:hypothetical protein E4U43_005709 [Claviceps pusilla]